MARARERYFFLFFFNEREASNGRQSAATKPSARRFVRRSGRVLHPRIALIPRRVFLKGARAQPLDWSPSVDARRQAVCCAGAARGYPECVAAEEASPPIDPGPTCSSAGGGGGGGASSPRLRIRYPSTNHRAYHRELLRRDCIHGNVSYIFFFFRRRCRLR